MYKPLHEVIVQQLLDEFHLQHFRGLPLLFINFTLSAAKLAIIVLDKVPRPSVNLCSQLGCGSSQL